MPKRPIIARGFTESVIKRFESGFTKGNSNECWEWQRSCQPSGYGQIMIDGKMWYAHRLSWNMYRGPIPEGEGYHGTCVLHKCDNPKCVNPNHLFLGSNTNNIEDMFSKGRNPDCKGENCGNSKLTNKQVLDIKRRFRQWYVGRHLRNNARSLGWEFDVHPQTIREIMWGNNWAHIVVPVESSLITAE